MQNNYDRVAGFYDLLAKLVFGDALMDAQRSVLHSIPERGSILIIGGGTGAILEEITRLHPDGLAITYIEISENMRRKAQQRHVGGNKVQFVHSAIEDYATNKQFDLVITSFLFDNFKQEKAALVFQMLDKMLVSGGKWLFTDFHIEQNNNRFWQKWLLKSMYLFFKLFSEVEANSLPDMDAMFSRAAYKKLFQKSHYKGFIQAAVYQKP